MSGDDDTPLPPGWIKGYSNSQKKTYYCHPETKHTQWHFPTATEAADPLKAKQRLQSNLKKRPASEVASGSNSALPAKKKSAPNSGAKSSSSISSNNALGDIISGNHLKIPPSSSKKSNQSSTASKSGTSRARTPSNHSTMSDDATSVAIIVPYRDIHPKQQRKKHLQQFVPFMLKFLSKQLTKGTVLDYHIYIIEQSDDNRKFNRGKLLNIGFDVARKNKGRRKPTTSGNKEDDEMENMVNHDVFIFHDVDLLPTNEEVLAPYYTQFPTVPIHIARVWDRYSNNPKYFGGIVSFSSSDMKRINGYPNTFWGWGGEDDEMQKRCERLNIKWKHPTLPKNLNGSSSGGNKKTSVITDLEEMNIDQKLAFLRSNREWKCNVKWEALDEHESTWRTNGLADLDYKILGLQELDSDRKVKSDGSTPRSRATKVTVDVKFNGSHWTNEKCQIDKM